MQDFITKELTKQPSPTLVAQLARLHIETIKDGFLSSLGEPLLRELYGAIVASRHAFIHVALDLDRRTAPPVGFIVGSVNTRGVYWDFLRTSAIRGGWLLLPRMGSIQTIKRVVETLLYPRERNPERNLPRAEILNFCVSPRAQRKGVGATLFAEMTATFERKGIRQIKIVTGESQVSARRFYEKCGAKQIHEIEVHEGEKSIVYLFNIEEFGGPERSRRVHGGSELSNMKG